MKDFFQTLTFAMLHNGDSVLCFCISFFMSTYSRVFTESPVSLDTAHQTFVTLQAHHRQRTGWLICSTQPDALVETNKVRLADGSDWLVEYLKALCNL